jgi:hypothetical protein
VIMLAAWLGWLVLLASLPLVVGAAFVFFPPLIPPMVFLAGMVMLGVFVSVGLGSSRALLKMVEDEMPQAPAADRVAA